MATRWGICSAGHIASDFVTMLSSLPKAEHQVVGVATASDQTKAASFARKYSIPKAYGSYLQLAQDPNVEVVYVGNMSAGHRDACMLFLEQGKNVLCEKPVTTSLADAQEVFDKAKEKKVFFMEGLWSRFFPAYRAMVQELNSGSLGDILCVRAAFSMRIDKVIEERGGGPLQGGSLMGMACYPLTYIQQVFKQRPKKIVALSHPEGADKSVTLCLQYEGGQMATAYSSFFGATGGSSAVFHGTEGTLEVCDDLHTPHKLVYPESSGKPPAVFPHPETRDHYNLPGSQCFVYQAQAVRKYLQEGLTESPIMTHQDSLTVMYILDEAKKQLGLK